MLLPLQALRVEAVLTSPSAFTPLGLHLGKCSPCSSLPISDCNLSTVLKLCNIDYNVIASLDTYFLSLTKSAPTTVVSLTFLKPTGKPHPQGHSILPIPSAQHALKYLHCLIWSAPSLYLKTFYQISKKPTLSTIFKTATTLHYIVFYNPLLFIFSPCHLFLSVPSIKNLNFKDTDYILYCCIIRICYIAGTK